MFEHNDMDTCKYLPQNETMPGKGENSMYPEHAAAKSC